MEKEKAEEEGLKIEIACTGHEGCPAMVAAWQPVLVPYVPPPCAEGNVPRQPTVHASIGLGSNTGGALQVPLNHSTASRATLLAAVTKTWLLSHLTPLRAWSHRLEVRTVSRMSRQA